MYTGGEYEFQVEVKTYRKRIDETVQRKQLVQAARGARESLLDGLKAFFKGARQDVAPQPDRRKVRAAQLDPPRHDRRGPDRGHRRAV
jgi:hypothetical protein